MTSRTPAPLASTGRPASSSPGSRRPCSRCGNHDDRTQLRAAFDLGDTGREDLSYAVSLGPVRLVALDSQRPGEDAGAFDAERGSWLAATLAADRATPTLLAMHHPPLVTGVPALDGIGLPAADRDALGDVLADHAQVRLIAAGHVHRLIAGTLGAIPVLAIPSTHVQLALDFAATELRFAHEPRSFAIHRLIDGELVSHVGFTG